MKLQMLLFVTLGLTQGVFASLKENLILPKNPAFASRFLSMQIEGNYNVPIAFTKSVVLDSETSFERKISFARNIRQTIFFNPEDCAKFDEDKKDIFMSIIDDPRATFKDILEFSGKFSWLNGYAEAKKDIFVSIIEDPRATFEDIINFVDKLSRLPGWEQEKLKAWMRIGEHPDASMTDLICAIRQIKDLGEEYFPHAINIASRTALKIPENFQIIADTRELIDTENTELLAEINQSYSYVIFFAVFGLNIQK